MTSPEVGTRPAGRPRDPEITRAIIAATLRLLDERGFARMSIEAVAAEAGVGKPAVYRRFRTKADLVASAIAQQLPHLESPDSGDTKSDAREVMSTGLPADGHPYLGFIGGLLAEYQRHPELIEAFRKSVLWPRRAVAQRVVEQGQARGDIRADIDPELAVDMLVGPFYARIIAGGDATPDWRAAVFARWWDSMAVDGSGGADRSNGAEHPNGAKGQNGAERSDGAKG